MNKYSYCPVLAKVKNTSASTGTLHLHPVELEYLRGWMTVNALTACVLYTQ